MRDWHTYHCHILIDAHTVMFEVWILVPLQHADAVRDGLHALFGAGNSKFNHS